VRPARAIWVEVGLQRRRHAEVVHRQAEDDDVGAAQLVDQALRVIRHGALRGRALFRFREERLEALRGEVRHRIGGEVANDDAVIRRAVAPRGDELPREPARLAVVGEEAGLDLQKRFHRCLRCLNGLSRLNHASIKQFTQSIKKRKI
jgi:hypothetical protein